MSNLTTPSKAPLSAWIDKRRHDDPELDGLSVMDRLWNQLDGAFPGRWAASFPDARAMANWQRVWGQAFCEEGIMPTDIPKGLSAVRRLKHPPSVGEFVDGCRPRLTDEDAFHEAVKQMHLRRAPVLRDGAMVTLDRWSDPAIYWAAAALGEDLFTTSSYDRIKGRWSRALDHARRYPKGLVPVRLEQLPAPAKRTIGEQEQKQLIGNLLSTLGKRAPEASRQGRRMKTLSDDDLTARKTALEQLLARQQERLHA